jgi:hypothetical protein
MKRSTRVYFAVTLVATLTIASAGAAEAPKAERMAKYTAMAECLKAANLEGAYVVSSAGVPAATIQGRSGGGMWGDAGMNNMGFLPAHATVKVAPDATTKSDDAGTFMKGELVVVGLDLHPKAKDPSSTPPTIVVLSNFKHNVTRGTGAFQHESAETFGLNIQPESLDVGCAVLTELIARLFERADGATVANWEKAHPEISNGVIVPSVREGMTTAEVEAIFGTPERRAEVGGKTMYYYPKMKVTFTDGKVSGID